MPEVELTEAQYEYLESLREEISEQFVGPYGHVRMADALQYLIDTHDGEVDPALVDGDVGEAGGTGTASTDSDGDPGDGTTSDAEDDDAAADGDDGESTAETDVDGDADDEAKLNSMMQLLDEYDDVWEKAGSDAGYEVELPEGGTETVKTKDDVRALLFKHYR